MNIEISLTEADLKKLVYDEIQRRMRDINLTTSDVKIEVKSAQNFRAEWETAHFRARVSIPQ